MSICSPAQRTIRRDTTLSFLVSSTLSGNLVCHLCTSLLVGQDCADQLSVVNLARAGIDRLQQLVHLLLRHLLAQVGQDVLELTDADKASHVLVEDLEAAAVLVGLAWVAEAAGAIEDALECLEVEVTANALLQIANLGHSRVLTACAQQIAEVVELDTAIAALIKQRECLLVVGRGLVVRVRSHVEEGMIRICCSKNRDWETGAMDVEQ